MVGQRITHAKAAEWTAIRGPDGELKELHALFKGDNAKGSARGLLVQLGKRFASDFSLVQSPQNYPVVEIKPPHCDRFFELLKGQDIPVRDQNPAPPPEKPHQRIISGKKGKPDGQGRLDFGRPTWRG